MPESTSPTTQRVEEGVRGGGDMGGWVTWGEGGRRCRAEGVGDKKVGGFFWGEWENNIRFIFVAWCDETFRRYAFLLYFFLTSVGIMQK